MLQRFMKNALLYISAKYWWPFVPRVSPIERTLIVFVPSITWKSKSNMQKKKVLKTITKGGEIRASVRPCASLHDIPPSSHQERSSQNSLNQKTIHKTLHLRNSSENLYWDFSKVKCYFEIVKQSDATQFLFHGS